MLLAVASASPRTKSFSFADAGDEQVKAKLVVRNERVEIVGVTQGSRDILSFLHPHNQ